MTQRKSKKKGRTSPAELHPRVRNSIISSIKRAFSRSLIHKAVMQSAVSSTSTGPRGGKYYICAKCGNSFPPSKVQVDHISPVVPTSKAITDMDWNTLVERIFTTEDNLQVLCKKDHRAKTASENKERRQRK